MARPAGPGSDCDSRRRSGCARCTGRAEAGDDLEGVGHVGDRAARGIGDALNLLAVPDIGHHVTQVPSPELPG